MSVCTTEGGVLAIFSTIAVSSSPFDGSLDFELLALHVREKGRIVQRLFEGAPQNGDPIRRNAGRRHVGPRDLVAHVQEIGHLAFGFVAGEIP